VLVLAALAPAWLAWLRLVHTALTQPHIG
jgi:hypothetical protein